MQVFLFTKITYDFVLMLNNNSNDARPIIHTKFELFPKVARRDVIVFTILFYVLWGKQIELELLHITHEDTNTHTRTRTETV